MATLTADQITAAWRDMMRGLRPGDEPVAITKPQLRAVIEAIDAWLDANAASANAAIPTPQRSLLTAKQKALILMAVITARYLADEE